MEDKLGQLLDRIIEEGERREWLTALARIEAARVHLYDRLRGAPLDRGPDPPSFALTAQQIAKVTGLSARFFYENGSAPFAVRISERRLRFDLRKFIDWRGRLGPSGS